MMKTNSGPWGRGWDHRYKCMLREDAEKSRNLLKVKVGTLFAGRRVKWKVRECPICHRFYVDRQKR